MLFTTMVIVLIVWALLSITQQAVSNGKVKQALPIVALCVIAFLWALVFLHVVERAHC